MAVPEQGGLINVSRPRPPGMRSVRRAALSVSIITISSRSRGGKQVQQALGEVDNLRAAQLALSIHTVHKADGHLPDLVSQPRGSHNHLHLEHISFGDARADQVA